MHFVRPKTNDDADIFQDREGLYIKALEGRNGFRILVRKEKVVTQ
jgi:hypothetical protein